VAEQDHDAAEAEDEPDQPVEGDRLLGQRERAMTIVNSGVVAWRIAASDEFDVLLAPGDRERDTMLTRAMNTASRRSTARGGGDRTMSGAAPGRAIRRTAVRR
jgi:hypothetical protein